MSLMRTAPSDPTSDAEPSPKRAKSPTEGDVHVGRLIRRERIRQGVTQEKLARAIGVSFQQVQKYENGTNRVSAGRLAKVGEVLGLKPEDLWPDLRGGRAAGSAAAPDPPRMGSDAAQRALRAFEAIVDPHVRRRVLALLEELAAKSHRGTPPA